MNGILSHGQNLIYKFIALLRCGQRYVHIDFFYFAWDFRC